MEHEGMIRDLCREMRKTYEKKNDDYGDSFGKSLNKYGLVAAMVRMSDKRNRIVQLSSAHRARVKGESIKDTLLDLACYALMTNVWIEQRINGSKNSNMELFAMHTIMVEDKWSKFDVSAYGHRDFNSYVSNVVSEFDSLDYLYGTTGEASLSWLPSTKANIVDSLFKLAGYCLNAIALYPEN